MINTTRLTSIVVLFAAILTTTGSAPGQDLTPAKPAAPPAGAKVYGSLSYPAAGNIQLDEGTIEIWVTTNVDTTIRPPNGENWGVCLFDLQFDNGHHWL